MDNTGSFDITAQLSSFPPLRSEPPEQIQSFQRRLRGIQNCCNPCRSLWGQWQKAINVMFQGIAGKNAGGTHPCRSFHGGMERLHAVSHRIFTQEDETVLADKGFDIHTPLPRQARKYLFCLVNLRCEQPATEVTEVRDETRAATHLYASKAMGGILKSLLKYQLRKAMIIHNCDYHPSTNGLFPLRDTLGNALFINSIANVSLVADSGRKYDSAAVKPFIADGLTGAEREELYRSLKCRKLVLSDLMPHETALLGQWGVVAATDLPAAKCLGIYSGTLVTPKDMGDSELFDHDYIIDISLKSQPTSYLDSDNILSKINTLYAYDGKGRPVCQAELGYNVEAAKFRARLSDGRKINIVALFTTEPIPAGKELRCNYHYTRARIACLCRLPRQVPPQLSPPRLSAQ